MANKHKTKRKSNNQPKKSANLLRKKRKPFLDRIVDRVVDLVIHKEPPKIVIDEKFGDKRALGVEMESTLKLPNNIQSSIQIEEEEITYEGYLLISQASQLCGLTQDTLRRLCKEGMIEALKVSGRWLVSAKTLTPYLN